MDWFKKHKVLSVIGIVILIAIIGGALGGGSETTNTNSNTQPEQSNTTPQEQEPAQEAEPAETKVSLDEFYEKVQNGQSKAEVTALAGGREPTSCTESENEYIGKMESCNYGGFSDGGMVSITFTNDKVSNKLKSNF